MVRKKARQEAGKTDQRKSGKGTAGSQGAKGKKRGEDARTLTPFGARLVNALHARGMNDSELAKALGIAQPNIHTLKFKTDHPRRATVMKIAQVLGLKPEDLFPPPPLPKALTGSFGESSETKVYLVIESKAGRQSFRLA